MCEENILLIVWTYVGRFQLRFASQPCRFLCVLVLVFQRYRNKLLFPPVFLFELIDVKLLFFELRSDWLSSAAHQHGSADARR